MFSEWLIEAYYLRIFLQLSRIPTILPFKSFLVGLMVHNWRR